MGIEDAGALTVLFSHVKSAAEIPDVLRLYEAIRRPRALELRRLSTKFKELYTLLDGPEQEARDGALRKGAPYPGWPNFMSDPELAPKLYGYDVVAETERIWKAWKSGALKLSAADDGSTEGAVTTSLTPLQG